jgi:hypothetical protein
MTAIMGTPLDLFRCTKKRPILGTACDMTELLGVISVSAIAPSCRT